MIPDVANAGHVSTTFTRFSTTHQRSDLVCINSVSKIVPDGGSKSFGRQRTRFTFQRPIGAIGAHADTVIVVTDEDHGC